MTHAIHFDGQTAQPRGVHLECSEDALILTPDTGATIRWPLAEIRRASLAAPGSGETELLRSWTSAERLRFDDPWLSAALEERVPHLDKPRPSRRGAVGRALFWSGAAIAGLALIVFVVIPALAPRLARAIPPEREIAFGEQVDDLLAQMGLHGGVCTSTEGSAALEKMVTRVSTGLDPRLPLRVDVVRSEIVNAVALPGGRILLFSPLIAGADTPEEVAGVLAHEIGHVQEAHPTREAIRASAATAVIGLLFGDFAGAGLLVVASDRVINTSYTRDAERDADGFAVERLRAARLPIEPLAGFMGRFRDAGGDTSMFGGWFATHPSFAEREERLARAESPEGPPLLSAEEWAALRNICR